MTIAVGVIGAGSMGSTHIRTISAGVDGARVVAVADVDLARARAVAAGATVYADPEHLISDPDVESVLIASSTDSHEGLVLACLAAGKPVLCEKPLAASSEGARRIVDAEAAIGRQLVQVGFMRRYDFDYVDLKRRLDEGEAGEPLLVHCVHRNAEPPPYFGTEEALTESVVHEVDVARWLLGQEIVAVTVLAPRPTRHAPAGVRDPQLVLLETEGGVLVDVESFVRARYGYDVRCEVVGETGAVALPARPSTGFEERFAQAYRDELEAWVELRPSGPTAWDGYAAAVVTEACLQSLASGGRAKVTL